MAKNREPPETLAVREFHALGKRILKTYQASEPLAGGKRRRGVAQAFNEKLGLQRDQVDKARQFATTYSGEEVEDLCRLGGGIGEKRITKGHLIRLLAVRNRSERHKLAKQAVRGSWSVQRLGAEICKRGKASQGGRRPQRPATVEQAVGQIQRMARQWERWVDMMSEQDDARGVGIKDLPIAVGRAVAKMSAAARAAVRRSRR